MAVWAKPKIFYSTVGWQTASSTATGDYSVAYLFNWLETNMWKAANTTTPMYITYDAGVGNTASPDYLAILGHNLKTIDATIVLQYSTDNFAADINDAFTAFAPAADTVILKEFTAVAKRYWRLKITGTLSAAPYMTLCVSGSKIELDYATASFDPYHQEVKATTNVTQGGYVAGIHTQYTERKLDLKFNDADSTLYGKIKAWWDAHGLKNLFIAWEITNNPNDVYLMRPDEKFSNPFTANSAFRDISLSFTGRKE